MLHEAGTFQAHVSGWGAMKGFCFSVSSMIVCVIFNYWTNATHTIVRSGADILLAFGLV